MKEETDSVLFDTFVKKVIDPGVSLSEPELRAYYDGHKNEFASPEMVRLESLSFVRRDDAQAALERLRKGSDPKWLKENAPGQTKEDAGERLPHDGALVATESLPGALREAIEGSKEGDARLAGDGTGPFDVVVVRQKVPSAPRPYEEARESIASKVFAAKRKAALDDWIAKLRARSTIVIHLQPEELKAALGLGGKAGG
jgi:hypothetical protein